MSASEAVRPLFLVGKLPFKGTLPFAVVLVILRLFMKLVSSIIFPTIFKLLAPLFTFADFRSVVRFVVLFELFPEGGVLLLKPLVKIFIRRQVVLAKDGAPKVRLFRG
jgi:hypothetical protein